ncbi:hypothetical protein Pma05_48350 [Plantactinospora mayteni]|uniref:Uncharacterized protein n=1 Tax=Plantactinospora mayteni TaxID=566021 RepID=A0ABQ4EUF3_9ACTN|nr:hypothetical protein Pma05_48350 [Plantactinospora mayteni]
MSAGGELLAAGSPSLTAASLRRRWWDPEEEIAGRPRGEPPGDSLHRTQRKPLYVYPPSTVSRIARLPEAQMRGMEPQIRFSLRGLSAGRARLGGVGPRRPLIP